MKTLLPIDMKFNTFKYVGEIPRCAKNDSTRSASGQLPR
jgi:hypothetical protein